MDRAEVAVRRPQHADEKLRVGTVLSRAGILATVRWDDDGAVEEKVRLGGQTLLAVVGTLRHQALVDRVAFAERFTHDPMTVFVELLREVPKALKAPLIKEHLIEFGLEKEAVDKAWKSTQAKLSERDDVQVKSNTYRWIRLAGKRSDLVAGGEAGPVVTDSIGGERLRLASGVPAPAAETDARGAQDMPARGTEETATGQAPESEQHEQKSAVSRPRRRKKTRGDAPDAEPVATVERPLHEVLAEVLGSKSPEPVQRYLATPLRAGTRLGKLDDSVIDGLLSAAEGQERQLVEVLLLAVPRTVGTVDLRERLARLDPAVTGAAIDAAADELRREPAPDSAVRTAVAWLVRRVSSWATLPNACIPSYVELVVRLSVDPQTAELDALDAAAHVFARTLPELPRNAIDVDILARIVRRLPFAGKGGRVALMAAIAQVRPDAISDDKWWNGVTVQGLSDCVRGPLGRVISLPAVIDQVIRPLMARGLSDVTTRARLSFFLGLPGALAEHIPASAVAETFRRIGDQDLIAASWMDELSGRDRLEVLQRDLHRAQDEAGTAVDLAEAAERRAGEFAERCARLERDLQGAHSRAITMRSAQERQVKIDIVRALADLAAEVEELSVGRAEPGLIVERVRGLVASQGLKPIGAVGGESSFDPAVHEPLVGDPEPDTAVIVIRPGYRWSAAQENVLLQKALVESA